MNAIPATIPTFIAAIAHFAIGYRLYSVWRRSTLIGGILLSLPCLLAISFYIHLFDHWIWFYEARTIPWIELSFSGIGVLGGAIYKMPYPLASGSSTSGHV